MRHEFPIHIEVILTSGNTQSWNIDRNMKYTEKGEGKHCRNCVRKGRPVDDRKVYNCE